MPSLNPYLSFAGNAREAIEFYRGVFGGDVELSTFGEFPEMVSDPADAGLVMHAQLTTPDGFVLMAADAPTGMDTPAPAGFSVSVSGDDEQSLTRYWEALGEGGTVTMPFEVPPWGGRFGMVTDRFGIDWMVAYTAPAA